MLLVLLLLFFFFIKGLIHVLSLEEFPPAVAQGALAVTCRADDETMVKLLEPLNHIPTLLCCTAERGLLRTLEGGCKVPIGKRKKKPQQHYKKDCVLFCFPSQKKIFLGHSVKKQGKQTNQKKNEAFWLSRNVYCCHCYLFFCCCFWEFQTEGVRCYLEDAKDGDDHEGFIFFFLYLLSLLVRTIIW